ncbi:ZIP zinc transporter domain-containing protein [Ditylenchus destructor]|nr:ZIP zinc transporter domain-containing protein [Ditylenchus destructor]
MFLLTVVAGVSPVKLLKLLRRKAALTQSSDKQKVLSLFLCMLSCFSGGVFLATCFLHLFPELYEHARYMESTYDFHWDYPMAELLSCSGFFLLFFLEELVLALVPSLGHGHSHAHHNQTMITISPADEESSCSTALAEPERCETNCERVKENPPIFMKRRPHAHSHGIRSITFVLAISFHSIVEGIALGVQNDSAKVWAIFISLMVHKLIVAFSVGLQLGRTHAHALGWVVLSILLFAMMTPIGGFLGAFVHTAQLDALLRDWLILVMQGVAVGTFLYVTFFEVLIHERDNEHPNLLKVLLMFIGFALIGLLRWVAEGHSHQIDDSGHSHEAHASSSHSHHNH